MYAATNLNDVWLAVVSSICALCCLVVIALTAFKRLAHRRTKEVSSCSGEINRIALAKKEPHKIVIGTNPASSSVDGLQCRTGRSARLWGS